MKTRMLGAALAIAALSGLLVPSPAQAKDGVVDVRVSPSRGKGGGSARAHVDFVNKKKIVLRNFRVRDICPNDSYWVRAQIVWVNVDGSKGYGDRIWRDNGCGHSYNYGTFTHTSTKPIRYVRLQLIMFDSHVNGGEYSKYSGLRDNPYTR